MRPLPADPTLPVPTARGLTFVALAAFGAVHWMVLLEPAEPGRALYALGAGLVAIGGLLAVARLGRRARQAGAAVVALLAFALAILGGGVADEMLLPDRWGELAAGIVRGIESLPGVRVPYRGVDEWTRIAIGVGGTVLVVAAALLAFWPRRGRIGHPLVALVLLVGLYAVPAVALDFESEFVRGAALALLVLAFLRLETLRVGDAGNAGLAASAAAVLALLLAPALDGDQPWWDYESWALDAASARTTAFSWDHDYGPLDWPRDGRELMRVRASRWPAYWKAANLDGFDGVRWRQGQTDLPVATAPEDDFIRDRGTQRLRVTIRNLSSRSYVTAGFADDVDAPTIRETSRGDGTWVAGRPLRRGDAYEAEVYTPQTNESVRREAGADFPRSELAQFRRLFLGVGARIGQSGAPRWEFLFPQFGDTVSEVQARRAGATQALPAAAARRALREGPYRRTWALAQRLRAGAETQEDVVQDALAFLRRGFAYTEQPPRSAYTLDGFLFDAKRGYCQQYSGAMALLLRMAGVPARVVTGFTSGSLDSETREYIVRDLDAHSWVEVWYRDIGWVTFDPTPASAPPRSQPDEATGDGASGASAGPPSLGGDLPADPGRRALAEQPGPPWAWIALGTVGGLLLVAAAVSLWLRRRRRAVTPPAAIALAELERALRRTRQPAGAGTTLRALEERFARRSPAAAAYVRAVRDLRYGGRPRTPTPEQRRGLRAELARGNGFAGRLRAWWALPPWPG